MNILSRLFSKKSKGGHQNKRTDSEGDKAINWSRVGKEFYYNKAQTLEKEGNYKEAEKGYRLSIDNKPKFVAAHNGLGFLLQKQKRYDEAVEVYRKACNDNPDNGISFQNLAFLLINLERLDEAEEVFKKGAKIAPVGHPIIKNIKSRLEEAKSYSSTYIKKP